MDDESFQFWKQEFVGKSLNLNDCHMRESYKELTPAITPFRDRWASDSYDINKDLYEIEKQKEEFQWRYEWFYNEQKHDKQASCMGEQEESAQFNEDFEKQKEESKWEFDWIQNDWPNDQPKEANCKMKSEESTPIQLNTQIPQIGKKFIQKEKPYKKKFYKKNFCRYILLSAFRTLEDDQHANTVKSICDVNDVNYNLFKEFYMKQRTVIMGYQVLKRELISRGQELEIVQRKTAFKQFLIWYMDTLATKHIMLSKKQDLKDYLHYKNYVMSYYVRYPEQWHGNNSEWQDS